VSECIPPPASNGRREFSLSRRSPSPGSPAAPSALAADAKNMPALPSDPVRTPTAMPTRNWAKPATKSASSPRGQARAGRTTNNFDARRHYASELLGVRHFAKSSI